MTPDESKPMNDYYEILGVAPEATTHEVKTAFREKAFQYHPDHCKDPDCADKMKSINEAYAVLSDPRKRKEYDLMRSRFGTSAHQRFRTNYSDQDIFQGSDIQQIFEEMSRAFGLRGFDEIFRGIYGQGYQSFEFKKPGIFVKGFVFTGKTGGKPSKAPSMLQSGLKKATGFLFGKDSSLERLSDKGADIQETIQVDEDLAKNGGPYAYDHRKRGKKLIVQIPSGIQSGQKIRLAGMGLPGTGGGPSGDLFLRVHVTRMWPNRLKDAWDRLVRKWKGRVAG